MTTLENAVAVNLSSEEFWSLTPRGRDSRFAELRRNHPVSWQSPIENPVIPSVERQGYWAVVNHDDVSEVSRNPQAFSSSAYFGGVTLEILPPALAEATQSIIAMDGPRHSRLRKLITTTFTPRRMSLMDAAIRSHQPVRGATAAGVRRPPRPSVGVDRAGSCARSEKRNLLAAARAATLPRAAEPIERRPSPPTAQSTASQACRG